MKVPHFLVILGPTASGKSGLAVKLAKKFDGEIISADSRQVYRGLDIGAGKITKREMQNVPHYLLDVANPKRVFSVAQYQKLAKQKIREILARNKLPIICGGTGFYIQAVVDDLVLPEVQANLKLRESLARKNPEELFKILQKLDKTRAQNIDKNNPRRLIRAIEIAKSLGQVPNFNKNKKAENENKNIVIIGLNPPAEKLKKLIKIRLEKRLKSGLITEVRNLHEQEKLSWKRLENLGLEYKFVALFLQKKIKDKKEFTEKLNTAIWHYAKRQMTWFKRDERIRWLTEKQALKLKLK
ncbi:MAG: tRNA (adenosine(37)-N6)-dimethylallyltransferase MiaA [Patescibacteria group bacterium]